MLRDETGRVREGSTKLPKRPFEGVMLAAAQSVWVRRAPIPAKQVGLRQMGIGLALVAVTAVGVLW